jgi:hypothetical protein
MRQRVGENVRGNAYSSVGLTLVQAKKADKLARYAVQGSKSSHLCIKMLMTCYAGS